MDKQLVEHFGENYGYVQTIVNNKVELVKIEIAEKVAKVGGYTLLLNVLQSFATLLLTGALLLIGVFVQRATEDLALTIAILMVGLLFLGALLFLLRKQLLIIPFSKMIYKFISDEV